MEIMKHVKQGGLVALMLAVICSYWSQMSVEVVFFKPLHVLLVSAADSKKWSCNDKHLFAMVCSKAVTNSLRVVNSRKIVSVQWILHLFNFSLYHILNCILLGSVKSFNQLMNKLRSTFPKETFTHHTIMKFDIALSLILNLWENREWVQWPDKRV